MPGKSQSLGLGLSILAAVLAGVAGLLALRLLFIVLIANPASPVTTVVYAASRPFLFPWGQLWPPSEIPSTTLERATLLALGTYFVLSLVLGTLGLAARQAASRKSRQQETPERRDQEEEQR